MDFVKINRVDKDKIIISEFQQNQFIIWSSHLHKCLRMDVQANGFPAIMSEWSVSVLYRI